MSMEDDINKSSEVQDMPGLNEDHVDALSTTPTSRRNFSRRIMVGSAVVASLANRPAWAEWTQQGECLSTGLLNSIGPLGQENAASINSHSPAQITEARNIEATITDWNEQVAAEQALPADQKTVRVRISNDQPPKTCFDVRSIDPVDPNTP